MANPNVGRFTWHELASTDVKAAVKFYTELFGWKAEEMDMGEAGKYTLFLQGKTQVGGAMAAQAPGIPTFWMTYVGSDDVDGAAKKIKELGGKVLVGPHEVPNMVRFVISQDPQGAAFGVVKNLAPGGDTAPPDGPPLPGTFCWDELHTSDQKAAAKFYSALFGWTGKGGDNEYWHWLNNGKDIGGMMDLKMPNVPPNWLSYIAAANVDASVKRVKELGGKVLMDAMDVPKVGRFAVVQDPTGGAFALYKSAQL